MSNLTVDKIDADIAGLMNGFGFDSRPIPSLFSLLRLSLFIPLLSAFFSLISILSIYLFYKGSDSSFGGYFSYLLSDGWIVVIPTVVIGLFFSFMTYNSLIMYMSVPKELRDKSVILGHLKKVACRTASAFLLLMLLTALLSGTYSRLAFAIPLLELVMFFAINLVVGSEINRLGAGLALEKISNLIKKI